ncbi:hypothetical protein [Clostridium perfringens]
MIYNSYNNEEKECLVMFSTKINFDVKVFEVYDNKLKIDIVLKIYIRN